MKKQNSMSKLIFSKKDVIELNQENLKTIVGGTGAIISISTGTVSITLTNMPISCTFRIYSSNGGNAQN